MKSISQLLLVFLSVLALAKAFVPVAFAPRTSVAVDLFGAFGGQKKPAEKKGGGEPGFLEGKGKKITVREDEDNAMWIEEPKDKKKDTKKGK
jgi:hypothetical protein